MGFYGQVIYEFTKLFSSINIKPYNHSQIPTQSEGLAAARIYPQEQWDELVFEPANKWITLQGNDSNNTITIGHANPGDVNSETVSFKQIASLPEGATATALNYGDYIQTEISKYDAAGHATEKTIEYYRLPASADEELFGPLNETVTHMKENFLTSLETNEDGGIPALDFLSEHNFVKRNDLSSALSETLQKEKYVTEEITGTLDKMYSKGSAKTIAETIGDVPTYSNSIASIAPYGGGKDAYTLSEALQIISNKISSLESFLSSDSLKLKVLIDELKDQVELSDDLLQKT